MQDFFLENITCAIYILKCIYICQFKPNLSPIAIRWSNLKINVQKMYLSLELKMVKLLQSTVYIYSYIVLTYIKMGMRNHLK